MDMFRFDPSSPHGSFGRLNTAQVEDTTEAEPAPRKGGTPGAKEEAKGEAKEEAKGEAEGKGEGRGCARSSSRASARWGGPQLPPPRRGSAAAHAQGCAARATWLGLGLGLE